MSRHTTPAQYALILINLGREHGVTGEPLLAAGWQAERA